MIDQEKKELRRQIKELKQKVSNEDKKTKSLIIFRKIEELNEFKTSRTVMAYWSMDDEVYTHDFVLKWQKEKTIILPVVKGNDLELRIFTGKDNMATGQSFGISEPKGEKFNKPEDIDLILVPGIAFDSNNNRLGRGKAYYDKLLKKTRAYKVGICFDFQLIESVPVDEHDVKMDLLISNN